MDRVKWGGRLLHKIRTCSSTSLSVCVLAHRSGHMWVGVHCSLVDVGCCQLTDKRHLLTCHQFDNCVVNMLTVVVIPVLSLLPCYLLSTVSWQRRN